MKKLVVMLAAAAMAVAAHAASVDWNVNMTLMDANFENVAGTVTFFMSDDLKTPLANSPLTITDGEVNGVVTGEDGKSWTARVTISNFDGESQSYYYDYVFDMDTANHPGSPDAATYLSALSGTVYTALTLDGALDLFSSPASQGFTAAGGGVPEPSSGLLILIGMAGLALRRKQK